MQNTKEHVVSLSILAAEQSGSVDFTPIKGKVIGCVIYKNDATNPGFVRAVVKDNAGTEISKLQSIDNYRSREAEYLRGAKPLNIETGGRTFTFEVLATEPFAADFLAELIFIYEPEVCPQY
jgi:hypothetical protein